MSLPQMSVPSGSVNATSDHLKSSVLEVGKREDQVDGKEKEKKTMLGSFYHEEKGQRGVCRMEVRHKRHHDWYMEQVGALDTILTHAII